MKDLLGKCRLHVKLSGGEATFAYTASPTSPAWQGTAVCITPDWSAIPFVADVTIRMQKKFPPSGVEQWRVWFGDTSFQRSGPGLGGNLQYIYIYIAGIVNKST